MTKRALISVSDKDGILELAQNLNNLGYEIISTGGTYKLLKDNNVNVIPVEDVTGFPECLGGRIKTLHPNIHGGILSIRNDKNHMDTLDNLNINTIDIVVVNLYPFKQVITDPNHALDDAIENIDIGGPSMIRAAAKNHKYVLCVTDKSDYEEVVKRISDNTVDYDYRFGLMVKAFEHTGNYDSIIANYFNTKVLKNDYPETLNLSFHKKQDLRYGENPNQSAAYYTNDFFHDESGMQNIEILNGKELSYNNLGDSQGAYELAIEFNQPVCVAVKHATPCGVGIGNNSFDTYMKAYESDPLAIFGGVVCFNCNVDLKTVEKMNKIFLEVIMAPSFDDDALALLKSKKNLRILKISFEKKNHLQMKTIGSGLLVQQPDIGNIEKENHKVVTVKEPSKSEIKDMIFAMKVVKHVKSNAIVIVKNGGTIGIGGGQVSRILAAKAALKMASENAKGAIMSSDAFFPFDDVVKASSEYGISGIIQPGGSVNDNDSIAACNENDISMILTGTRHFKH